MSIKEYQQYLSEIFNKKQKINKKLGLGIMIWENLDYIFKICTELRTVFDYIILGWQDKSYDGQDQCLTDEEKQAFQDKLIKLHSFNLIDNVIVVEVNNLPQNTLFRETYKRNILTKYLQEEGAEYTMIIDCDEFHFADDILKELRYIIKNDIDSCYTNIKNFVGDFNHVCYVPDNERLNGLCKASTEDTFVFAPVPGLLTDLTRTFNPQFTYHVFDKIYTYHFSWIRKNYAEKLNNYSQKAGIINPGEVYDQLNNFDTALASGVFKINNENRKLFKYTNKKLKERLKVLEDLETICGIIY